MPDLINMVGEPKAPPHSNTSFLAKISLARFFVLHFTETAFKFSKTTLSTIVSVRIVKFFLSFIGFR